MHEKVLDCCWRIYTFRFASSLLLPSQAKNHAADHRVSHRQERARMDVALT